MIKVDDIAEGQIMFYDIEATSQFAPYAELKMVGVQYGLRGQAELVESWPERKRFRAALADPDIMKVSFNGINYDNPVLYRHGYPISESNCHDLFLMAKTVAPRLPAYSLKYINWHYFGDTHNPEMVLHEWLRTRGLEIGDMWQAPKEILGPYCLYDVHPQTVNLFCLFWEIVQRPLHWKAYTEVELPMGPVMEEIMLRGGEFIDVPLTEQKIATLQDEKDWYEDDVYKRTKGKITNPNSVKQVGEYLRDEEGIELALTDKDNFSLKKTDVLEFLDLDHPDKDRSKIIRGLFEVRRINNTLSYYRNYLAAIGNNPTVKGIGWIPKQYSLSGARTRRILSNSKFKLNFQNPNEAAKEVQIVPPGWLGCWFDATQIENVVHIFESNDTERRLAYEADEDFNEYVWLCNTALGGEERNKKTLDNIPSPINPQWSVYKQFKTAKLALNFGMGIAKYCRTAKLPERAGKLSFTQVLSACPAIKQLPQRVAQDLTRDGYVQDVFGHIYSGGTRVAYKVVAYLIQGCGTGSLPKVQMKANYDTIHQWDKQITPKQIRLERKKPNGSVAYDEMRGTACYGVMSGTTHDENGFRLSLDLGADKIIATLQQCAFNMTKKYSDKFDGIPLRAKMYLGRGYTSDRIEVNPNDTKTIRKIINAKIPTR